MEATRLALISLLFLFSTLQIACGSSTANNTTAACSTQEKANSFLVKWKSDVPAEFENQRLHLGSNITRFNNIEKSELDEKVLSKYQDQIEISENEYYVQLEGGRLDAASGSTCTSGALPPAWGPSDIQASNAWSYSGHEGEGVIVAVVDSGVDITHQLLHSQIWVNSHEIPSNGIDDDHNGYIDDYNGFSVTSDINGNDVFSSSVSDDANHGTHVSGIIAGQAGPGNFTGVAPRAQILPFKFIDGTGAGAVGDAIKGIDYALANGARVINASWGGSQCSTLLQQTIANATSHGIVFANAAGNGDANNVGLDIDLPQNAEWPAVFQMPGKITVGSMDQAQSISSFSNFGNLVDLVAPGESILSTVPQGTASTDNQLCTKDGTSMATPFVSGVAALLLSAKPTASATDITNAINNSVVPGRYGVRTGGKLNALNAVQYLMSH